MRKFVVTTLTIWQVAKLCAQDAPIGSSATPATAADVEALRRQVQSLTETVKTLQQQLRDQQAAMEKVRPASAPTLAQGQETPAVAGSVKPSRNATPPPIFPTEDNSVVAGAP